MKKINTILLLSLLIIPTSYSALDGNQPFIPTALEWMTLKCKEFTALDSDDLFTLCRPEKPNTIILEINYGGRHTKAVAEAVLRPLETQLMDYARAKGWAWFKVNKEYIKIKMP